MKLRYACSTDRCNKAASPTEIFKAKFSDITAEINYFMFQILSPLE